MEHSPEIKELATALATAQGQMGLIALDSHARIESTRTGRTYEYDYSSLSAVLAACQKPLADNGLAIIQSPSSVGEGLKLTTMILHSSGQWVKDELTLHPVDASPQSVGSAISYGRRYTITAMLRLTSADDDGAEAGNGHKPPVRTEPGKDIVPDDTAAAICPIHNVPMTQKKNATGEAWYSHKLPDGSWCNAKPKGATQQSEAEHWSVPEAVRRAFYGWLGDTQKAKDTAFDWEIVKAEALKVDHLKEYAGSQEAAKRAIVAWLDSKAAK